MQNLQENQRQSGKSAENNRDGTGTETGKETGTELGSPLLRLLLQQLLSANGCLVSRSAWSASQVAALAFLEPHALASCCQKQKTRRVSARASDKNSRLHLFAQIAFRVNRILDEVPISRSPTCARFPVLRRTHGIRRLTRFVPSIFRGSRRIPAYVVL
jgi:hypothetical protein